MDTEISNKNQKEEDVQKEGIGPAIGTIVIIIVLLAGAYYFYSQEEQIQKIKASYRPESTSTLAASIEAELSSASSTNSLGK